MDIPKGFEGEDVREVIHRRDYHEEVSWDREADEWGTEPDKVQWTDKTTGLPCMIVRGPLGGLCGYVGVNPDHQYHGKDYGDVDVDVHGGLTFANKCHEGGTICHTPKEGEEKNVWWFGFDCGHSDDKIPGFVKLSETVGIRSFAGFNGETYKNLAYVKRQVERLASQLKAVAPGLPNEQPPV
jgi:hypothetical protein